MKIFQFPLVKITLFFVLGILFAYFAKPSINLVIGLLFSGYLIFGFTYYKSLKSNLFNFYFGVATCVVLFLSGIFTQTIHNDLYQKNHYFHQIDAQNKKYILEVSITEKLKFSAFNNRFVANVKSLDNKKSSGKIILNIRKDSVYDSSLKIGNILKINANVYKNKAPKNPNQFDYGKYLENQNIFAQIYCQPNEIEISSNSEKSIWYYTEIFRDKIIKNLEKNGFAKKELAVVVALILGQQQDISPDILQDYQFAGAIHVLSVSGLHVGFILLFVSFLLKPFPNTKKWKTNKLLIIIASLWLFGFVAGLAPSVLRSVVMFSFVAIGRHLDRGVNVYNTILVSALLILMFKPSFLFDVGFQLSYISLFFIVWLQPMLSELLVPKNKIIGFFWDIFTVSVAAQVGAMGLSIYYFNQFPGLFFITNLVILPAMGIVLALGVIVMILAFFDCAPYFLTHLLQQIISFLNLIIAKIASLEQFVLQNIFMNKTMVLFLYLMIFAIVIYFKKPKFNRLIWALSTVILFQITIIGSKVYYQKQNELVVFNEKKNTIIAERFGQKTIIFTSKNITKNKTIKQYILGNYSTISSQKKLPNLIFFKNQKILILDSLSLYNNGSNPDVLIITKSPKLNLDRFLQNCQPKIVVADASNYKTYVNVWKRTCQKNNIQFYDTSEKGFFVFE